MRRVWVVTVVLGLLAVFVAHLWAESGPPSDANIGAGLLAVTGIAVSGLGALCLVGTALHRLYQLAHRFFGSR